MGEEHLSRRRGAHAPRAPIEELRVDQCLERCDPCAHRWLPDEERLGGGGEGARVGDRDEGLEVPDIDGVLHNESLYDSLLLSKVSIFAVCRLFR